MALSLTYLCGIAVMVFIAVGLAMAAVRWFHMCKPYDRNPRYYYPGRPFVAGIYVNSLVLLPFVLNPESPDAWYMVRLYYLPVTIYHFTLMLYAYFGNVMQWRKWRGPMLIVGTPVALALLAAFVLALIPGRQVGTIVPMLSLAVLYALGIIVTLVCAAAMWLVLRWARSFYEDDFSNPADFPVPQARRWIVLVAVNVALCWTAALSNSMAVTAVVVLLFAVASVLFIISALHPHRNRPVEEEASESAPRRGPSRKKQQEILQAIHTVVVEQQAYLDPHLTIQDVADRSGYARSTLSGLFKANFGGFFSYVNSLRLRHVDDFLQQHPQATIQDAAYESGFSSRQAYYAVKAKLEA